MEKDKTPISPSESKLKKNKRIINRNLERKVKKDC